MTLPDEFLNINTPENVTFDYEVAGLGSRFLAALVDTSIILVLQVVIIFTFFCAIATFWDNLFQEADSAAFAWLLAGMGLLSFAFLWGYYILFELLWNGQSPGKRWVGLRVIQTDGAPITLSESTIRNLLRLIDFLPAYYGLGVVVMFINGQSRRLGDLAAGTLVVWDRATVSLESLAGKSTYSLEDVPGIYEGEGALESLASKSTYSSAAAQTRTDLPTERLNEADFRLAEDFWRRRYDLTNGDELARRIAAALGQRMGLPAAQLTTAEAEKLIRTVAQARRSQG